jgi:hypothetical protein
MKTPLKLFSGIACLALCAAPHLIAGELTLPASALERDAVVPATYSLAAPLTGAGRLALHWTDTLGRVVEERTIAFEVIDEREIHFPLDLRRAVAMKNHLQAHVTIQGKDLKGSESKLEEDAELDFVAMPPTAIGGIIRSLCGNRMRSRRTPGSELWA